MEYRFLRQVLVHDGEGGTAHGVAHAELLAQGFDQRGLSGPEIPVKSDHCAFSDGLQYGGGRLWDLVDMVHADHLAHLGRKDTTGISISSMLIPPCWKVCMKCFTKWL